MICMFDFSLQVEDSQDHWESRLFRLLAIANALGI